MAFRDQEKRGGRVVFWVSGLLLLVFAGLMAFQWYKQQGRQNQDDNAVERLKNSTLVVMHEAQGDVQDWPQWRGVFRDGTAPGEGLLTAWPEDGPPEAWKIKGGAGFSAVSVVGKRLVTQLQDGEHEAVVCWEDQGKSAKELWRFRYPSPLFSKDGEGPRATPTIADEQVYTVGPRGHLYCLTLTDGKEVWKRHLVDDLGGTVPKWGFSSSPLVEGDLLLINPGGDRGAVVGLDRKTGETRWQALKGHPGYSSPVICMGGGVRQVLFFLGAELVSLNPQSGEVYWRYPWETQDQVNAATPIVLQDVKTHDAYVFLSSGYGKGCGLVRVFRGGEGKPQVQKVYENNLMHNHFGSSVYYKDHVYGFSEGHLTCMKLKLDGRDKVKAEWSQTKFNKGTLALAGDHLIVLGEKGFVALVEPTPEKFVKKAEFTLKRGGKYKYWTMPVVAHGRLYIRDEYDIYCFDLKKE